MPKLRIDFQDGFADDGVTVRVNGQTVVGGASLRTARLTGKASSTSVDVPAGPVVVEVELPGRNLRRRIELRVEADTYLGISRTENGLEHIQQSKPFGYA